MSFRNIVIVGGGPVGLLCAIDARDYFKSVCVIEKRSEYTRTNAPVLDADIRKHFKALGVHEKAGLGRDAQGAASFSRIEKALIEKAVARGVKMLRPYVITDVLGDGVAKGGRYKSMKLTVRGWDDKQKGVDPSIATKLIQADIVILASGGGTASDPLLLGKFGFQWEKLKAKNYGAYGIFDTQATHRDQSRAPGSNQTAKQIAHTWITFDTPDHKYLLVTLSGISSSDFKSVLTSTGKLKDLMSTIMKAAKLNEDNQIKEVEKNVGAFKIGIQRAKQMFSPTYPALLVGDAAVTPHPEKGSGYTTGFRGFEEVHKLFSAVKETHRSKDNSIIYQAFNDRYELHVSRKAIEGTFTVLANVRRLLKGFVLDAEQSIRSMTNSKAKALVQQYVDTAKKLDEELMEQENMARAYSDYLKPDTGTVPPEFEWDMSIGRLWEWISATWADVKIFSKDMQLLDERLDSLKLVTT